jgi:hypothetical protein
LIPIPILKVLSSFQKTSVQALLMGGQACVLYGAAEFSRDTDFAILAEPKNLEALQAALDDLKAEVIALPPFEARYLERGHAIHFRCRRPDVAGLRVDVMSKMRDVDAFAELWKRRTTFQFPDASYDVLALPDLVQAKKTQRDKDWPMIRRLVDTNYFQNRASATPSQINFWLRELRTPELLVELAARPAVEFKDALKGRPFLQAGSQRDIQRVEAGLELEEKRERAADREYWKPLREELAALRRARLKQE